jgi:hypothetical protein
MECWRSKVQLVLEGVPPHAWDKEVVQDQLGSSCAIDAVEYTTTSRENLDLFKVSAWTTSLDRIPPARTLAIPEPEEAGDEMPSPAREFSEDSRSTIPLRPMEEMKLLKYKVLIHVDSIEEDLEVPEDGARLVPPSPISDQSGLPSPPGFGGGRARRRLPWRKGVQDKRGEGQQRSHPLGNHRSFYQVVAAEPGSWKLPAMVQGRRGGTPSLVPRRSKDPVLPPGPQARPVVSSGAAVIEVEAEEGAGTHVEEMAMGVPAVEIVQEPICNTPASLNPIQNTNVVADVEEEATPTAPCIGEESVEEDMAGAGAALQSNAEVATVLAQTYFEVSLSKGPEAGRVVDAPHPVESCDSSLGLSRRAEEDDADSLSKMNFDPLESHAGPNAQMQLVQVETIPDPIPLKDAEVIAMGRMRVFCARILKALAPPLLREVQLASVLRPQAEPFTPRRSTRVNFAPAAPIGKQPKKASAAETVLLKALGITPAELSVNEEALQEFKQLFDSPMREQQLQVLASVFGKTMPAKQDMLQHHAVEIYGCA